MKNQHFLFVLLVGLAFILVTTSPVSATLLVDIDLAAENPDPTDTNPTYWTGSDENPFDGLVNSNPRTEEAWLEAVLGLEYDDPSVNYFTDIDYGDQPLSGIDPGFVWEYSVVKYDTHWAAFENDFSGLEIRNVSHITYFNAAPVPEPGTIVLMGLGLVGLAGVGRKRIKP